MLDDVVKAWQELLMLLLLLYNDDTTIRSVTVAA